MTLRAHAAGGLIAAGFFCLAIKPSANTSDLLIISGTLGGILPDLDILFYFLRKRSLRCGTDFRHHTWITHTFPFYILPALALSWAGFRLGFHDISLACLAAGLGASVHLVQDMVGSGDGIMILYPVSRKMAGIGLTGTHGPEWARDFAKSPAFLLEQAVVLSSIILALIYGAFRCLGFLQPMIQKSLFLL